MISTEPPRQALPSGNRPSACRSPGSRPESRATGDGSLYYAAMGMVTTRPPMAIFPKAHTVVGKGIEVRARNRQCRHRDHLECP